MALKRKKKDDSQPETHIATPLRRNTLAESKKLHYLRRALERQLLECDAKWALFVAAAHSVFYDEDLQPAPPMFVSPETGLRIDDLTFCTVYVPQFERLLETLLQPEADTIAPEILELLYWVLVTMPQPEFAVKTIYEFGELMQSLDQELGFLIPTHVFGIQYTAFFPALSAAEAEGFPVRYGFFSTSLEKFFAFVNRQQPSTGESTTSVRVFWELNGALGVGRPCPAWGASLCGSVIGCIAVCEVALNPARVFEDSFGAFVQGTELLIPHYLLFYGSNTESYMRHERRKVETPTGKQTKKRRYVTCMSICIFLLFGIRMYGHLKNLNEGPSFFVSKMPPVLSFVKAHMTNFFSMLRS